MKKLFLLVAFLPLIIQAQILTTQPAVLNFGNVNVGDKDSLQISVTNHSNQAVNVTNLKFYVIYGNFPFSASQTAFSIPAGGSQSVWIYFEPEHNILHNSELIIQHSSSSGVAAVDLNGQGVFPMAYYSGTQNLEEESLKVALKSRISQGYLQRSYNQARDFMFMTIDNEKVNGQAASVNTLECVYTGYKKTAYTNRSDAQNTNPQFNTEHTFPQSFFNSNLPMVSDIHHLFPTTNNSNSQRGSKPFGTVTNGTPVTLGGGSFYNSSTFEPRNAQKGSTARAMMYFVIRYQDYGNHFSVQENILRNWHNTYSVDSIERKRNDDIFAVQNNRNPFIDYPQLEERITNFVSFSSKPTQWGLDILQTSVNFGNYIVNQADTFNYVLVNRGNQIINFSNFTLSNQSILSFAGNSGSNTSLSPGDAIVIRIVLQGANSQVNETLSFNTNIPGSQSSFTIPVRGTPIITSLTNQTSNPELEVYPNPAKEKVYINGNLQNLENIKLYNSSGQLIWENDKPVHSNLSLDLRAYPSGLYYLELSERKSISRQRIVKY